MASADDLDLVSLARADREEFRSQITGNKDGKFSSLLFADSKQINVDKKVAVEKDLAACKEKILSIANQITFVESISEKITSSPSSELDHQISALMQLLVETRYLKKGSSAESLSALSLQKLIELREQLSAFHLAAEQQSEGKSKRTLVRHEIVAKREVVPIDKTLNVENVAEQHWEEEKVKHLDVLSKTFKQSVVPKTIKFDVEKEFIKEEEAPRKFEDVKAYSKLVTKEKIEGVVEEVLKPLEVQVAKTVKSTRYEPLEEEVVDVQRQEVKKTSERERIVEKLVIQKGVTTQLKRQLLKEEYTVRPKETPGREILQVEHATVTQDVPVDVFHYVEKVQERPKNVEVDVLVEHVVRKEKEVEVEQPKLVFKPQEAVFGHIREETKVVQKKVPVERPVADVQVVEVEVPRPKVEFKEKSVNVDKIVFRDKEVPVNVDRLVYKDKPIQVKVERLTVNEIEEEVVLHRQVERAKPVETEVRVEIPRLVFRDEEVKVQVAKPQYEEREVKMEVSRPKEKAVSVEVPCETRVEQLVVEERAVEVPVDRIIYTDGEVEMVAVERLVPTEFVRQVPQERRIVKRFRERAVPVEKPVRCVREKAVWRENEIRVPVEKVVHQPRRVEVPAGARIETTTRRPVPMPNYIEVPVDVIVRREKVVTVPVERIVTMDRKVPVEVATIIEVPKPYEKIVQVPVERIVYQDRPVNVNVEKINERSHEIAVRVENTVYKDKIIEVEVETVKEKLVPWENIMEVPVQKVVYKDRELTVPVLSLSPETREVKMEVVKTVFVDKEIPVPVEKIRYVDKPVEVKVDKLVYKDRVVEVPVEHVQFEENVVGVQVPRLVEKQVPFEVVTERRLERTKPVEKVEEVKIRYNTIREKDKEVPVEQVIVEEKITNLSVQKIVEPRLKEVEQVLETVQETVVYKDKPVEIPVERLQVVQQDVTVPITKVAVKTNFVSVREKVHVDTVREEPVIVERLVHMPVEKVVRAENLIELPVERVCKELRSKEVVVEHKIDKTTHAPRVEEVYVDVEVASKVRYEEETPIQAVQKAVYQDRTVDVPVHTITERLVTVPREVEVPLRAIQVREREQEVRYDAQIEYVDKERLVPIEKPKYVDHEVVVELHTTQEVLKEEEHSVEASYVKTVYKEKQVEVPVEKVKIEEEGVVKHKVEKIQYVDRDIEFPCDKLKVMERQVQYPVDRLVVKDREVVRSVPVDKVKVMDRNVEVPKVTVVENPVERVVEVLCHVPEPRVEQRTKEVEKDERIKQVRVEQEVQVEVEVPEPAPVRVSRPVPLERQSLCEHEIKHRVEVSLKKPVGVQRDRPVVVERTVERLKEVKTPKDVPVKKQVPYVLPQPKKERRMRTTQAVVSVPEFADSPHDLSEQCMRRETKEQVRDLQLKTRVVTEIVKEEPRSIELQRTVHLFKEVPGKEVGVPVEVLVEVDVHSDADGGGHTKRVIEQLDAELRQARARELRFAAEMQALALAMEEARQRCTALRGELGRAKPAQPKLFREEVLDVPVEREELFFEEEAAADPAAAAAAATARLNERQALLKTRQAEVEVSAGETSVMMERRDEAQVQRLLAKRRLERVLERERALKQLERDLRESRSDQLVEVQEVIRTVADARAERVARVAPQPRPRPAHAHKVAQIKPHAATVAGAPELHHEAMQFVYPTAPAASTPARPNPPPPGTQGGAPGTPAGAPASLEHAKAQSAAAARTPGNFSYGYGGADPPAPPTTPAQRPQPPA